VRYPFSLDYVHCRAMLYDRLLSSRDCRGTIDLCGHFGECHSTRANRISEVDWGFGFVVLSVWVVNWKQTRRDANKRNPEDNDHPSQILHGKVPAVANKIRRADYLVNVKRTFI
jgi:hypothetical protein